MYGKPYWNKKLIKYLEGKGFPLPDTNNTPSLPPKLEKAIKVEDVLDIDSSRHIWTPPGNLPKPFWLYPAIIYDLYKATGKWYYKSQLIMPTISSIVKKYEPHPYTEEKIKEILMSPAEKASHWALKLVAAVDGQETLESLEEIQAKVKLPPAGRQHTTYFRSKNPVDNFLDVLHNKEEFVMVTRFSPITKVERKEDLVL